MIDRVAVAMVEQIDYDWRRIRLSRGDLVQCVVRLREFDRFVRDFLVRHPAATVVHLGCGLDARFQRVDNGQVRWVDLDLPDVIALRRRLLPETDRNRYVAASAFDPGWMDQLAAADEDSVLFVAEAVLPYFEEANVKDLIVALRRRFPGAELVTDMCTPLAVRLDNLHLLVTGFEGAHALGGAGSPGVGGVGPGHQARGVVLLLRRPRAPDGSATLVRPYPPAEPSHHHPAPSTWDRRREKLGPAVRHPDALTSAQPRRRRGPPAGSATRAPTPLRPEFCSRTEGLSTPGSN